MFYTGQIGGGHNVLTDDMNLYEDLVASLAGEPMMDPTAELFANHSQLKTLLLPFTLNDTKVFFRKVGTPDSLSAEKLKDIMFNLNLDERFTVGLMTPDKKFPTANQLEDYGALRKPIYEKILKWKDDQNICVLQQDKMLLIITNQTSPVMVLTLLSILPFFLVLPTPTKYPFDPKMFYQIGQRNYPEWLKLFKAWADPIVPLARRLKIDSRITDIFSKYKDRTLIGLQKNVEQYRQQADQYLERWRQHLEKIDESIAQMRDYTLNGADLTTYAAYWKTKPQIWNIEPRTEDTFCITLRTPVFNYDLETVEALMKTPRTNFMNQNKRMRNFYRHIFINRDYELILSAALYINLVSGQVSTNDGATLPPDAMPNIHLHGLHCFGSAEAEIIRNVRSGNMEMVIEQLIACAGMLNFNEAPVQERMLSAIQSDSKYNRPCIREVATDRYLTPKKFMEECEREAD